MPLDRGIHVALAPMARPALRVKKALRRKAFRSHRTSPRGPSLAAMRQFTLGRCSRLKVKDCGPLQSRRAFFGKLKLPAKRSELFQSKRTGKKATNRRISRGISKLRVRLFQFHSVTVKIVDIIMHKHPSLGKCLRLAGIESFCFEHSKEVFHNSVIVRCCGS